MLRLHRGKKEMAGFKILPPWTQLSKHRIQPCCVGLGRIRVILGSSCRCGPSFSAIGWEIVAIHTWRKSRCWLTSHSCIFDSQLTFKAILFPHSAARRNAILPSAWWFSFPSWPCQEGMHKYCPISNHPSLQSPKTAETCMIQTSRTRRKSSTASHFWLVFLQGSQIKKT